MRKIFGLARACALLTINLFVFSSVFKAEWAIGITAIIAIIAYLGEYASLAKDRAIPVRDLDIYYKSKLESAYQLLCEQGNSAGIDLEYLRLYMVPDERINAYSYGRSHIGVTRGLLALDEASISGVLAHESGHCIIGDAFIKRILFCDITIIILSLSIMGFLSTGFLWIVFALLCFFGIGGGFLSFFITGFLSRMIRWVFTGFQHIFLFIYQITVGMISRNMEYSADHFAAKMNFGNELAFFLSRFSLEDGAPKTLRDIMYASHPTSNKRIKKIEEYCYTTLSREVD